MYSDVIGFYSDLSKKPKKKKEEKEEEEGVCVEECARKWSDGGGTR